MPPKCRYPRTADRTG